MILLSKIFLNSQRDAEENDEEAGEAGVEGAPLHLGLRGPPRPHLVLSRGVNAVVDAVLLLGAVAHLGPVALAEGGQLGGHLGFPRRRRRKECGETGRRRQSLSIIVVF